MVKKVFLNIPDDSYKELASLSSFYEQDVKDSIISILDIVGSQAGRIINLSKEYKVPMELLNVLAHMFDASFHVIPSLFNKILEILKVKGLYTLEDFGIDLDENTMWFFYAALLDCNLQINNFYVQINPGLKYLDTKSYIDFEKVNDKSLEKLDKLIESVKVPEEFYELEDYKIEIDEDGLKIECTAESLSYLPSVKKLSEFVKQIFKKAGIE
jgi:hypothetical protein